VRTVGRSGRPALAVDAFETIPLAVAEQRMPEVSWPDCPSEEVRFYDGDVHVADAFPPSRGNEVFDAGVLEDGWLEEDIAAKWLSEGKSILRDA
jgi:hypothetical protein